MRHENFCCGRARGGEVGGVVWEHVHSSDVAHLRFTIVHAGKMMSVLGGEPSVFSYRRRAWGGDEGRFLRMKGCLYPIVGVDGKVGRVLLAEFIEI